MTIFIILMIIILVAASFAFAPAAPQNAQPPSSEIKLPEGYMIIAPPQKPKAPSKPDDGWGIMMWNIIMGIVFILVVLSLLIIR